MNTLIYLNSLEHIEVYVLTRIVENLFEWFYEIL